MRNLIITLLCILPFLAKGQQSDTTLFLKYVSKAYRLPEAMKNNCSWAYAIVSVKTNKSNKILSYHFINSPPDLMRKNFDVLIGYQFSKEMKINGHPIIFYLLVENSETCTPKPGDTSYTPNQIFNFLTTNFDRILKEDPRSIIFSTPVYNISYPSQKKQ